jgi:hypothetical protein
VSNPETRDWTINATPPPSSTYKPTSHLIIDSRKVAPAKLTAIENLLYGTASVAPSMPSQAAIAGVLSG